MKYILVVQMFKIFKPALESEVQRFNVQTRSSGSLWEYNEMCLDDVPDGATYLVICFLCNRHNSTGLAASRLSILSSAFRRNCSARAWRSSHEDANSDSWFILSVPVFETVNRHPRVMVTSCRLVNAASFGLEFGRHPEQGTIYGLSTSISNIRRPLSLSPSPLFLLV